MYITTLCLLKSLLPLAKQYIRLSVFIQQLISTAWQKKKRKNKKNKKQTNKKIQAEEVMWVGLSKTVNDEGLCGTWGEKTNWLP